MLERGLFYKENTLPEELTQLRMGKIVREPCRFWPAGADKVSAKATSQCEMYDACCSSTDMAAQERRTHLGDEFLIGIRLDVLASQQRPVAAAGVPCTVDAFVKRSGVVRNTMLTTGCSTSWLNASAASVAASQIRKLRKIPSDAASMIQPQPLVTSLIYGCLTATPDSCTRSAVTTRS